MIRLADLFALVDTEKYPDADMLLRQIKIFRPDPEYDGNLTQIWYHGYGYCLGSTDLRYVFQIRSYTPSRRKDCYKFFLTMDELLSVSWYCEPLVVTFEREYHRIQHRLNYSTLTHYEEYF